MPVYNESKTIKEILKRVKSVDIEKEIIIVDDNSTDGTREILEAINNQQSISDGKDKVKVLFHERNRGKGAAIRTGLKEVTGDVVIIQDADLEYDPQEYLILIRPLLDGKAEVVYGSRFLHLKRITLFWHYVANKLLNFLANVLYGVHLTDIETCYKMLKADIIKGIDIKSDRFNFEPEITAKILKRGYKIYEVPISYTSRNYSEGKKIGWKDAFSAFWTLLRYRFVD